MDQQAFDLGDEINKHKVSFRLHPVLWDSFIFERFNLYEYEWKEVKLLNDNADDLHESVNSLPRDKGGIYLFMIKSSVLPKSSEYLVYVGRAQLTGEQNLRDRIKQYYYKYYKHKERPKITRLIDSWGANLYVRYIELVDNDAIVDLEARLINSLLPPFNDEIPEKTIRHAVQAFN